MTTHDLACFENWLEHYATEDERALSYEKQIEQHIMWLAGGVEQFQLENIPREAFGEAH